MPPRPKPRADYLIKCSRRWEGIVWHHSVVDDGTTMDWEGLVDLHTSYRIDGRAVDIVDYKKGFMQRKGIKFEEPFRDIGFHLGVEFAEVEGAFVPILRKGRSLELPGAHLDGSPGHNSRYLGLCVIGNFDTMSPRPEMYDLCLRVTRTFMDFFQLTPDQVLAHHELSLKNVPPVCTTCPGKYWDFSKFRKDL